MEMRGDRDGEEDRMVKEMRGDGDILKKMET
jgi:hypothetical protein